MIQLKALVESVEALMIINKQYARVIDPCKNKRDAMPSANSRINESNESIGNIRTYCLEMQYCCNSAMERAKHQHVQYIDNTSW